MKYNVIYVDNVFTNPLKPFRNQQLHILALASTKSENASQKQNVLCKRSVYFMKEVFITQKKIRLHTSKMHCYFTTGLHVFHLPRLLHTWSSPCIPTSSSPGWGTSNTPPLKFIIWSRIGRQIESCQTQIQGCTQFS